MDAAAVACLASCIHEPSAVDIGGYVACAVVLEGKTGAVWSVDANSVAPAKARPDMYELLPQRSGVHSRNEDEYGCSVKNNANVDGALSVGVPGTLAGIGTIWERWGKLKWPQIVAPAQELVEQGFRVSALLAAAIRSRRQVLSSMPPAAEHFMPGGKPLEEGQIWHRPGMDWTLRRLGGGGLAGFLPRRDCAPDSQILLIRLFQQATAGSVLACQGRRFRRRCANSNRSSRPKKPANGT